MPELATKADIAALCRAVERQTWTLTVRLGVLIILGLIFTYATM